MTNRGLVTGLYMSVCCMCVSSAKHHVYTVLSLFRKLDTARGKLQDAQKMLSQAGLVMVHAHTVHLLICTLCSLITCV